MAEVERSEKITINVGLVDLGQIDLLVEEGFYANRTDFIRTAIRRQLESRATAVADTVAPWAGTNGGRSPPRGTGGRRALGPTRDGVPVAKPAGVNRPPIDGVKTTLPDRPSSIHLRTNFWTSAAARTRWSRSCGAAVRRGSR